MGKLMTAVFKTRRDAEMVIERLVQELGVERTDIVVLPEGDNNSSGVDIGGSDSTDGGPSDDARRDGAHDGAVIVSVDISDSGIENKVSVAFDEFAGRQAANER